VQKWGRCKATTFTLLADIAVEDRPAVLRGLEHYRLSNEVQDGVVYRPDNFLVDGHWRDYQEAPTSARAGKGSNPRSAGLDASKYTSGGKYGHLFNNGATDAEPDPAIDAGDVPFEPLHDADTEPDPAWAAECPACGADEVPFGLVDDADTGTLLTRRHHE
jgi:hypothetical protein